MRLAGNPADSCGGLASFGGHWGTAPMFEKTNEIDRAGPLATTRTVSSADVTGMGMWLVTPPGCALATCSCLVPSVSLDLTRV